MHLWCSQEFLARFVPHLFLKDILLDLYQMYQSYSLSVRQNLRRCLILIVRSLDDQVAGKKKVLPSLRVCVLSKSTI